MVDKSCDVVNIDIGDNQSEGTAHSTDACHEVESNKC